MTTVSILAVLNDQGGRSYVAVAGDRRCGGKTPGEALDSMAAQFDQLESSTLVVLQNQLPDQFFTAEQRDRLAELMTRWRTARDNGSALPPKEQAELDAIIEAEVQAAGKRAETMADELAK
jgi:hypothetical protein